MISNSDLGHIRLLLYQINDSINNCFPFVSANNLEIKLWPNISQLKFYQNLYIQNLASFTKEYPYVFMLGVCTALSLWRGTLWINSISSNTSNSIKRTYNSLSTAF